MHRTRSGGWPYSKVSRDSLKAPSLCAAVFHSKILHAHRYVFAPVAWEVKHLIMHKKKDQSNESPQQLAHRYHQPEQLGFARISHGHFLPPTHALTTFHLAGLQQARRPGLDSASLTISTSKSHKLGWIAKSNAYTAIRR